MSLLFRPFSFLPSAYGMRPVPIHWFVPRRREPVSAYTALVRDHAVLRPQERLDAETFVDGLFSAAERDALRSLVWDAMGATTYWISVALPVALEHATPLRMEPEKQYVHLRQVAGDYTYPFPFDVMGFTPGGEDLAPLLPPSPALLNGIRAF